MIYWLLLSSYSRGPLYSSARSSSSLACLVPPSVCAPTQRTSAERAEDALEQAAITAAVAATEGVPHVVPAADHVEAMPRQTASASKGEAALQVTPPAAAQAGDLKYRDQLVGAWKLLTGSIGAVTKMDEMCRRPGAAPLQALLSGAQAAQFQDIRSANEAIAVLQKLCLEAGVEVEDGATAAKQAAVSAAAGAAAAVGAASASDKASASAAPACMWV